MLSVFGKRGDFDLSGDTVDVADGSAVGNFVTFEMDWSRDRLIESEKVKCNVIEAPCVDVAVCTEL